MMFPIARPMLTPRLYGAFAEPLLALAEMSPTYARIAGATADAKKNIGQRNSSYLTKPGNDHPKTIKKPSAPNAPTNIILGRAALSDMWPNTMAPRAKRPPRTPRKIRISRVRARLESLKAFGRRKYIPKIMV